MLGFGKPYRTIGRINYIFWVLSKHGLTEFFVRLGFGKWFPRGAMKSSEVGHRLPELLTDALDELGSTFIKFGQMLSSRPDLLPKEYYTAFSRLQDNATAVPFEQLKSMVEKDLGAPLSELFASVDPEPVASASIAQVHSAKLKDGREVVLKIRRPGIEKQIEADLGILRYLAETLEANFSGFRFLQPVLIVEEFGRMIRRELDFTGEASAAQSFAATGTDFKIPQVHWDYTANRVLCLEHLKGESLRNWMNENKDPDARRDMATRLGKEFMRQFFDEGTFHADPHPGNILVLKDGQLALVDFGAIGHLDPDLKMRLGLALFALVRNDSRLLTAIYSDVGRFEEPVGRDQLILDVEAMMSRYTGIPTSKIDLGELFAELLEIARTHRMLLPRSFVLLSRSDMLVSNMVRQLSPDASMIEFVKPYAHKMARNQFSVDSLLRLGSTTTYDFASLIQNLPHDLRDLLKQARQGNFRLQMQVTSPDVNKLTRELDHTSNRIAYALIISGLGLTSALLMMKHIPPTIGQIGWFFSWLLSQVSSYGIWDSTKADPVLQPLLNLSLPGMLGLVGATIFAVRLLWAIERSGKLK